MPDTSNLTGRRFGRLVVLGPAGKIGTASAWECQCDCGGRKRTIRNNLTRGVARSCGCLARELSSERASLGPNPVTIAGEVAYIELQRRDGSTAAVVKLDAALYPIVEPYRWHLDKQGYAFAWDWNKRPAKRFPMHRLLLANELGGSLQVDHIDRDKLNNLLSNLRAATKLQNSRNQEARSRSGFKGVTAQKKHWQATIRCSGKTHYLGVFNTPEAAAKAYNTAAQELFGEFAWLNPLSEKEESYEARIPSRTSR